uniref:Protein pet100 log mitochondrial n=1 Tax=Xenopsylla cheopis TaxID=163159 RepID=A0A6M2DP23_XENCH
MGGWKLEVAKMAMYLSFPVVCFHYFNQPALFENWVIRIKRELYPPDNIRIRDELEKAASLREELYEQQMINEFRLAKEQQNKI